MASFQQVPPRCRQLAAKDGLATGTVRFIEKRRTQ